MVSASAVQRVQLTAAGLLGIAMAIANALGYVLVVIFSRSLGPADFGGYTALASCGVLLSVPMGAFQVVVARRLAQRQQPGEATGALTVAIGTGLLLAGGAGVLSPGLASFLHVGSATPVVLLALATAPLLATGCFQGILLGKRRLKALAVLYVTAAGTRLVAAMAVALLDLRLTGIFASLLIAALGTAIVGAILCLPTLRTRSRMPMNLMSEVVKSNGTLAAFVTLTSIDVVLARNFLSPHASGGYALAAVFGRALCWITQFVALLLVPPRSAGGGLRSVVRAQTVVAVIGGIALLCMAAAPTLWITLAGGDDYREFAGLAVACTALGVIWASVQVWLFAELSDNKHTVGVVTWCAIVVECLAIAWFAHSSAIEIVLVAGLAASCVILAAVLLTVRRSRRVRTPLAA